MGTTQLCSLKSSGLLLANKTPHHMATGLEETGEELFLTSDLRRGPFMCHRPPEVLYGHPFHSPVSMHDSS